MTKRVNAISGNSFGLRSRSRLEPAGGPDDKVFPPTYAGGLLRARVSQSSRRWRNDPQTLCASEQRSIRSQIRNQFRSASSCASPDDRELIDVMSCFISDVGHEQK